MNKVRVGVKYCGGCNERYDRMGVYRRIVAECGEKAIFMAAAIREDMIFDWILVVCGCQAQCANVSKLKSRYGIIPVFQDTDPALVVQKICHSENIANL